MYGGTALESHWEGNTEYEHDERIRKCRLPHVEKEHKEDSTVAFLLVRVDLV